MPEEMKTAQTTVETGTDSHADVGKEQETVNEATFVDEGVPEGAQKPEAAKQTKEQNSENARRRREAERRAEIKKAEEAARDKAIIETLGGRNPYTNEDMKDSTDVKEYLTMREIEKNGGDPLSDYSKYHKQKERERAEQAEREAKEKEWFRRDSADFTAKHPEVDLRALVEDESFRKFAAGKVGDLPLSEIYEGFMEVIGAYEKKAKNMARQFVANANASPGSLVGTNPSDSGFFTREQVQKMTQAEVSRNYDKIRASMTKWK